MNEKLLKWFIGTSTERDEREQQEIAESLGTGLMYVAIILPILLLINIINDAFHHHYSMGTFSLFALLIFISIYSMVKMRKYHLDNDRVHNEQEYKKLLKKYRMRCTLAGVYFGVVMAALNYFLEPMFLDFSDGLSPLQVCVYLFSGVLFGFFIYFFMKSKIQKEYDE